MPCPVTDVRARSDLGEGPVAVRRARAEVRRALSGHVPDDAVDTAVLLVSELVTNATLHVGGPVRLGVLADPGTVRVQVHDCGSRLPNPRRALGSERVSGRGLHLVAHLSQRWGAEPEQGGKVVWFELGLDG